MKISPRIWLTRQLWSEEEPRDRAPKELVYEETKNLSENQKLAVQRGLFILERYGGLLLADAVGLGKTRIALGIAEAYLSQERYWRGRAGELILVAPTRLRRQWNRAAAQMGGGHNKNLRFISHYEMSRGVGELRPGLVLVDEAHGFRNPDAKRSQNLARLVSTAPVVLITASPVCTSSEDLRQLLSYFLTDQSTRGLVAMGLHAAFEAYEAKEFDLLELLEEVVIRREKPDFGGPSGRPRVRFEILSYEPSGQEAWVWRNLESHLRGLTLEATGSHWPPGLMLNTLMRMWESGPDALFEALEDLLHYHERWLEAYGQGRLVDRRSLKRLFRGVSREQQVFPFFFTATPAGNSEEDAGEQREDPEKVAADLEALQKLSQKIRFLRGGNTGMVQAIVQEVLKSDSPLLIFAVYQAAAEAIFRALIEERALRVALITGDRAQASGLGRVGADEILERFEGTPGAQVRYEEHERIRTLVATDCISEGTNLQGCSTLILADLPYSPLRLEQRLGRVVRPGALAREVKVYLPRPTNWSDSLGLRRRLDERLTTAESLGARHGLAEALCTEKKLSTEKETSALAILTEWDRLRNSLMESPMSIESQKENHAKEWVPCFLKAPRDLVRRAGGHCSRESLLVHYQLRRTRWRRNRWMVVNSERILFRRTEVLPLLRAIADRNEDASPWEPGGPLWERAQVWLRRRRGLYSSAQFAPPLVGEGSEPLKLWRYIQQLRTSGRLDLRAEELRRWQEKIFQCHRRGILQAMEEVLNRRPSPRVLRRFLKALPEPLLLAEEVEIEVIGALLLNETIETESVGLQQF